MSSVNESLFDDIVLPEPVKVKFRIDTPVETFVTRTKDGALVTAYRTNHGNVFATCGFGYIYMSTESWWSRTKRRWALPTEVRRVINKLYDNKSRLGNVRDERS